MADRRLDPERYRRAAAHAEALRTIIPRFGEQKAFIRVTEPITPLLRREMRAEAGIIGSNRDRAVCALVTKACNTHAAIRVLTDAGHGDDAMALGRVLLENAALLQWLLIDPIYRLDLYCISDALYRRRWRELMVQHFQEKPEIVAAALEQVDAEALAVADFFGDTIHKWAQVLHPNGKVQHVNFDSMMKEIAAQGETKSSFQHDVVYFLHSAFVHSTASAMRSFWHLRLERYVRFDLGPNDFRCDEALDGATIFLFQVLQAAAQHFGFKAIEAELDALFVQMKADRTARPDPANQP